MLKTGIIESMHTLLADYAATAVRLRDENGNCGTGLTQRQASRLEAVSSSNVANLDRALEWAEKCPAAVCGAASNVP